MKTHTGVLRFVTLVLLYFWGPESEQKFTIDESF